MADIKLLESQRDEILSALQEWTEEQVIRDAWYHKNSLAKDELNRQIDEAKNGPKPTEMVSMEAVTAEVQASKVAPTPKEIKEG